MTVKRTHHVAIAVMVICIFVLLVDAALAAWRKPGDDALVKSLQQQVKKEASVSVQLDAELKRITTARQARKLSDRITGFFLIAASALFLLTAEMPAQRFPAPASGQAKLGTAAPASPRKRLAAEAPPGIDLQFVDYTVARIGRTREFAIPLLQAIQNHYRYLPEEALRRLAELTAITPAQIAGTSSFYGQFRRRPVGEHIVKVCHGTACHVAGAKQITEELRRHLELPDGADTDSSRMFTLEEAACLGCCSLAPVLMVDDHTSGKLTPASAAGALDQVAQRETV